MPKQPKNALERAMAAMAATEPAQVAVGQSTILGAAVDAALTSVASEGGIAESSAAPQPVEVPAEFLEYPFKIASAHRHLTTFCQLGGHKYITPKEYERMCLVVAGDERRLIQRILLVLAQRAQLAGDVLTRDQVRLFTMLHEREALLKHLALA